MWKNCQVHRSSDVIIQCIVTIDIITGERNDYMKGQNRSKWCPMRSRSLEEVTVMN